MIGNTAWLLIERVLRTGVGLLVNVSIARHLGPSDFGLLSYALAFSAIFGALSGLGIDDVLFRELARRGGSGLATLVVGFRLKLIGSIGAFAATLIVAWAWQPDASNDWLIVATVALGICFTPADVVDTWFHANERTREPAAARLLAIGLSAFVKLALVAANAPVMAFAAAVSLEAILIASSLALVFLRSSRPIRTGIKNSERASGRLLLTEGWPLMLSSGLVIVVMQSDRIVMERYLDEAVVGSYAVAARMSEVLYALPLAIGTVLFPGLASARISSVVTYWNRARRMAMTLICVCAPISFGAFMVGGAAVVFLFGEPYRLALEIFEIHIWTLPFVALVSMRSRMLVVEGRTISVLIFAAITAGINLAGNFAVIPLVGAKGAAYVSLLSWGFSAIILPFLSRDGRRIVYGLLGRPIREI